jgi:hypothetical protein
MHTDTAVGCSLYAHSAIHTSLPIRQQHSPRCRYKNALSETSRAASKGKLKVLSFLPMKQYLKTDIK